MEDDGKIEMLQQNHDMMAWEVVQSSSNTIQCSALPFLLSSQSPCFPRTSNQLISQKLAIPPLPFSFNGIPSNSAYPSARFIFCSAWVAAPFNRLSIVTLIT